MSHFSGGLNAGNVNGLVSQVSSTLNSAGGKETVMGWVHWLQDQFHAHAPEAKDALRSAGDQLKSVQGAEHLGDALTHLANGKHDDVVQKMQDFASHHGIDANSIQKAIGPDVTDVLKKYLR
jgi:hypothetical protein